MLLLRRSLKQHSGRSQGCDQRDAGTPRRIIGPWRAEPIIELDRVVAFMEGGVFWTVLVLGLLALLEISARIGLRVWRGYDGAHLYQNVFDPYKNILPTRGFVDTHGLVQNPVGFRRCSEVSVRKPPGGARMISS